MSSHHNIHVRFLGAAGTVTGSKYLVQTGEKDILIDCGMFQGLKPLRERNWAPFPLHAFKVDLVLLTHGHLDHVGYLPRLVNEGFGGRIWGTAPTLEIAKVILEDSAKLQEEDAERANKGGFSRHHPAKPLYRLTDVERTLPLFEKKNAEKWHHISTNIKCRFRYNGHILGATFIELLVFGKLFVFSGDIGRDNDLLMRPPHRPESADILFIESTYGDRLHPGHAEKTLENIIHDAAGRNGTIIIPGFAVERIQLLTYLIWQLRRKGTIPNIPVYTDSPMGKEVLDIFHRYPEWHKLSVSACTEMCRDIRQVQTPNETEVLAADRSPKIVIAGSGMASGGRVLTYFQKHLDNPASTILLTGYQAEGTRGRQLLEGAAQIRLLGKYYTVKAQVKSVEGLSAHADQNGLIDWMRGLKQQPEQIFIVHGEQAASAGLQQKIREVYGWESEIPVLNETQQISTRTKTHFR
jgi:metallo-beta-lactamase family protein